MQADRRKHKACVGLLILPEETYVGECIMMKKLTTTICVLLALVLALPLATYADDILFEDVSIDDWFYNDVVEVYTRGIMDGHSSFVFAPRTVMTRAEFVELAAKLAGVDTSGMESQAAERFSDVEADDWFASCIGWSSEIGLVTGYDDGTFCPNKPITRQELAIMIVRFLKYKNIDTTYESALTEQFADRDEFPKWSAGDIDTVRRIGIIEGDEHSCFNPKKSATRAEIAATALRIDKYMSEHAVMES